MRYHCLLEPLSKLEACLCYDSKCLKHVLDKDKVNRRTALHLAARYNRSSCIRILIEAGADIDAIDKDKATPLTLAAWVKDCASIEILNSLKARMGHLDHECRTNIEKCYSGKFIILKMRHRINRQ